MENFDNFENNKPKESLSEQEIVNEIQTFLKNPESINIERKLENSEGIYLLELKETDKETGEIIIYSYMREGDHGNNIQTDHSHINVAYFDENYYPLGGEVLAKYDAKTASWTVV